MKDKQLPLLLLGVMIGMQYFCYFRNPFITWELPFCTALTAADTASGNLLMVMYAYIPIPFFLILFSGDMRCLFCGYGLLLSVRGEKRTRSVLRNAGKITAIVAVIVFAEGVIYFAGRKESWGRLSLEQIFWALGLYVLAVCTLIQLQCLLELYMEVQYALALSVIGGAVFLFVSGCVGKRLLWIDSLLFLNLAFAEKNGTITAQWRDIEPCQSLLILLAVYLVILGLILKAYEKRDMI